jgi:retron-type reverse transcriptase
MLKTYNSLYRRICDYNNLELAFRKAKRRRSSKSYVIEFEKKLTANLIDLRNELAFHTYTPAPLKTFTISDPKTRRISKSEFRDRVIHHALVRVIEPIFEKIFICDSYANRKGRGVHAALERFDCFKQKVSRNNTRSCYVLKADVKHYFDTVDHHLADKTNSGEP